MTPTNVVVSGGNVALTANKLPSTDWINGVSYPYTSGTFTWKQYVTINPQHPAWEVRVSASLPDLAGSWPAFWMTPTNQWNCESDIMECWGNAEVRHGTYGAAAGNQGGTPSWSGVDTSLSSPVTAWHNYRLVALQVNSTDVQLYYYVDDVLIYSIIKANFVNNPLFVICDFQIFGDDPYGESGRSASAGGPATFASATAVFHDLSVSDLDVTGVTQSPINNNTYQVVSANSGKVLNVDSAATANGSKCIQYDNGTAANESWWMTCVGNSQYVLFDRNSGRVLDDPGWSTSNGTQMDIWDFSGGANDLWTVTATSGGNYKLVNAGSGKALDVSGASTANGGVVDQWDYIGAIQEQWKFQ
jgi:hypothetical protein